MRKVFRLDTRSAYLQMDTTFEVASMVVANPTASPIFIRVGAYDQPSSVNADIIVPAGESESFPVSGYAFAAAFGNVSAIPSQDIPQSGLFQTAVIILLDDKEKTPTYGSASFLSLSTSPLTPNAAFVAYSGTTNSPVYDLGAWGGALILIAPDPASGQAIVTLSSSDTGASGSFKQIGQWAIWPNVPAVIQVPRAARYFGFSISTTGIVGEPNWTGNYSVRATLQEILAVAYTPTPSLFTWTFAAPHLGTDSRVMCTIGFPAITIGMLVTSGAEGQFAIADSGSATGPWVTRLDNERFFSGALGTTFERTLGNPGPFCLLVVNQTDAGSAGGCNGSLVLSIRQSTDQSSVLEDIYKALGNYKQLTNTNQSIFHELQTIITDDNTRFLQLGSIDSRLSTVNTNLTTANTTLNSINSNIGATNTALSGVNINLTTIITSLTTINTSLGTINTSLGTINTSITTTNTTLSTISTNIATLIAPLTRGATGSVVNGVTGGGIAVFVDCGVVMIAGWYITHLQASAAMAAATANTLIAVAYGTNVAATSVIYETYLSPTAVAGGVFMGVGPERTYTSIRSAGIVVPANNTHIWVSSAAPFGCVVQVSLTQTP